MASFDRSVGAVRPVDIARNVLHQFVLTPASDSVRSQFQDQPTVQSSILAAVGDSYRALGMYESAEKAYRTSLELRESTAGPNHPDVARILLQLAIALRDAGKVDESAALVGRAIQIRESALGTEHAYVGIAIGELAGCKRMQHKPWEAEELYRRALQILEVNPSEEPDASASLRGNLALVLTERADYAGAEVLYRAALADLQRTHVSSLQLLPTIKR